MRAKNTVLRLPSDRWGGPRMVWYTPRGTFRSQMPQYSDEIYMSMARTEWPRWSSWSNLFEICFVGNTVWGYVRSQETELWSNCRVARKEWISWGEFAETTLYHYGSGILWERKETYCLNRSLPFVCSFLPGRGHMFWFLCNSKHGNGVASRVWPWEISEDNSILDFSLLCSAFIIMLLAMNAVNCFKLVRSSYKLSLVECPEWIFILL